MANIKIYKRFFYIFDFPKDTHESYTHIHIDRETDKAMAIGEIADLPKN